MANGGDSIQYWVVPQMGDFDDILFLIVNQRANSFVYLLNYIPAVILDLSLFTGNLAYSLLGYIGFIYLYKIIKELMPDMEKLKQLKFFRVSIFPTLLFLPNLHFWSSGVGKDSLLFFSIILFVYSIRNVKKRFFGLFIAVLVSITIRPHITLFLLAAFGGGYLIDGKLKVYQKVIIFMIFIIGFVSIFDYVLNFVQLESLESTAISEYTAERASVLNRETTGSGVDISGYPLPLKMFTFLYRPLFFDINGIFAILASFENLILLLLTILIILNKPIATIRKSNYLIKGMLIYFLMGTLAFSLILGNLGIMLRQKNMFIPVFLVIGIWILYHRRIFVKNKAI
ncbi:MAG: hypothetical protein OQJ83_12600 [Altibacter sp.]|nr:hypothetical protein [Altibacter sp.]